jgi:hypothetical protein
VAKLCGEGFGVEEGLSVEKELLHRGLEHGHAA